MEPFRATYQKYSVYDDRKGEPETVLVIAILPEQTMESGAEVVFIRADGTLCQDAISRFTNCTAPWPEN